MKTLLQLNCTSNWGSTGKIAENIGEVAISNGWESYIAYSRYVNPSNSKLIKIGNKLDVIWHVLLSRLFDKAGLGARNATKRFIHKIKKIKPDIVHLHNIHGYVVNYKLLFEFLNETNIQVVWTFHDCWAFTGHCAHFVTVNCDKWETGCSKCPLTKEYPKSFIDKSQRNYRLKQSLFSENQNLCVVPASNWLANHAKKSFLKDKNIRVIHNGINLFVFKPSEYKSEERFKIIAVSNVWNRSKGLYDVFRLRELLTETEFEITLVGLNNDQLKSLPNGINGIARTQSVNELVNLYSASDVLINPTYADTFPTVNIESIACGTPVITYRTGGSPEAIDENTGIVVEQGDLKGLVAAIDQIRSNGKSFYSANCRKRAEDFFNKDDRFQDYVELYERLLKTNR